MQLPRKTDAGLYTLNGVLSDGWTFFLCESTVVVLKVLMAALGYAAIDLWPSRRNQVCGVFLCACVRLRSRLRLCLRPCARVCVCARACVRVRASPSFYVYFCPAILTCLFIHRTH